MNAVHRVSASKLYEAMLCGYPYRPDVPLEPDTTGPAALVGNAIDDLTGLWVEGTPIDVAAVAAKHVADPERVALLWPPLLEWLSLTVDLSIGWAAQLWLVYNARTERVRVSTREEARKTKRDPMELSCVADLAAQVGPDRAVIWDVKTGNPMGAHQEQLDALGVAASRWFGVSEVTTGFAFVTPEQVHVRVYAMGPEQLELAAMRIEGTLLHVPEAEPTPGDVCRWCRAKECGPGDEYRRRMGWRRKK